MQTIRPCLWYTDNAEEAASHYTSIFADSRVLEQFRYGKGGPLPEGTLITAIIELQGQEFMLLNGGANPDASFSDGISFAVTVETQEEVDHLWHGLTADGGEPGRCGWLKDKFGVSWQIVPKALMEVLNDEDSEKSGRALQAMMGMGKLDIAELRRAHAGTEART